MVLVVGVGVEQQGEEQRAGTVDLTLSNEMSAPRRGPNVVLIRSFPSAGTQDVHLSLCSDGPLSGLPGALKSRQPDAESPLCLPFFLSCGED